MVSFVCKQFNLDKQCASKLMHVYVSPLVHSPLGWKRFEILVHRVCVGGGGGGGGELEIFRISGRSLCGDLNFQGGAGSLLYAYFFFFVSCFFYGNCHCQG